MYSESSTNLNNYIEQLGGRTFVAKLECSSFSIESGIKSIRYNGGSNSEQGITIGSTVSANIEVTMSNTEHMLTGQEISLFLGAEINGALEYIPMGIFKANKPNSTDYDITFTAHDRMASADKVYSSKLTYPTTSDKVINEIANILGVQFIGTIEPITLTNPNTDDNASNTVLAGYTIREAIGFMAALYGKFAVFNRFGQLEFRWYEDNGYELPMSKTYSFDKTESYTIDKVVGIAPDDTKYQSGSGTQGILFSSQFLTKNTVDEIYNSIGGFTYNGANATFLGDCRLDPWDIVTYTDLSGKVYKIPVMSISHDIDGGLTTTISAFVDSSEDISDKYSGPVTKAMERTHAELLLVNQLLATKITAEEVEAEYVKTDQLDAVSAEIENAVITNIDGKYASIDYVESNYTKTNEFEAVEGRVGTLEANSLTSDSAVIKDLTSGVADINTLIFGSASGGSIQTEFANAVIAMLGDAQIKSAMIDSVTASKITSGDIITNNVRVMSEDGKLLISDNTIQISDGNTVRVQIGKDANNDYSINIWDADGNLMFSEGGITDKAIKDAIIRDDMVSENANISAGKLNIDSLFEEINKSSKTIKSTQIYMDDEKQTLNVAFKEMTTEISELEGTVITQGTQLGVVQGQISSKIWQQDISGAISDIEIGGRNLVLNSGRWNDTECPIADTSYNVNVSNLVVGKEYTVSFEIKSTENYTGNTAVVQFYNELDERFQVEWVVASVTTEYKKASHTFVVPENTSYVRIGLRSAVNRVNTYRYLQVEEGNISTSYKVAPEDTENQISTLNTQYSEVSQEIDSISATVASHTTQISGKADNDTVMAVRNQVTVLEANLDGFKTTVSDTYTTKTEFNNLEIGGRNLLKDSAKYNDWYSEVETETDYIPIDGERQITISLESRIASGALNTTYCTIHQYDSNKNLVGVVIVMKGALTPKYSKRAVTFASDSSAVYVKIIFRAYTYFRHVKVEYGSKATDWTIAPEDTEEQITTLDTKYTEVKQNVDSISATVESNTTQIANKADNSTVTAVQNQLATLSLSLDEFQTTVSSTYTTKEEFNALDIGAANILRYMNAYTSDNKYAVTATKDNFYVATAGRVYLTSGRTYTFSCETDGVWQSASSGDTVEAFLLKDNAYTTYFNITTNPYTFTVETSGYYTLRLDVNQNGATHSFWNIQIERGNKATDWKQNLYDTEEEITSVRTIATQNADKFNWIVESGTSSTDFTLTDRMAELTASIISLNGDVKVSGDMLVDGAVTAEKISVGDLYALGATIGGLTVDTDKLYMGDAGMSSHQYYYAFWAGETNGANGLYAASTGTSDAKFRVSHNGKMYASDAEIEGKITTSRLNATGGVINLNASSNTSLNKYTYMKIYSSNNDYVKVSSLLNDGGQIDLYSSLHHMYITPAYVVGRASDGSQGFQLNGSGGYLDISNYIQTEGYIKADGLIKSSSGFSVNPNSIRDIGMYYANDTVSIKNYYGSIALQTEGSVHCVDYANSTNVPIYASAFTQKSSKRYKAHLGYMSEEEADRLLSLDVVKFDYINGAKGQYGLYAEDTYTHIPTCVYSENGVIEGIDYTKLIPFIIKKLQMQNKHIEELDNLVNHLIGIAMT